MILLRTDPSNVLLLQEICNPAEKNSLSSLFHEHLTNHLMLFLMINLRWDCSLQLEPSSTSQRSYTHKHTHMEWEESLFPKVRDPEPVIITHPLSFRESKAAADCFESKPWTCSLYWCLKTGAAFWRTCCIKTDNDEQESSPRLLGAPDSTDCFF